MDRKQSHTIAPMISSKITNSEETKKMVRGRSIGKKARKAPHQAQTPKIVKQIPKNTRMNNNQLFLNIQILFINFKFNQ